MQQETVQYIGIALVVITIINATFNRHVESKVYMNMVRDFIRGKRPPGKFLLILPLVELGSSKIRKPYMALWLLFLVRSTAVLVLLAICWSNEVEFHFMWFKLTNFGWIDDLFRPFPSARIFISFVIWKWLLTFLAVLPAIKNLSYALRALFQIPVCLVSQAKKGEPVSIIWHNYWTPKKYW